MVTGKDYARGRNVIGAVGYRRPYTAVSGPRLWKSTDMGNSWTFVGKLFDVGAYNDPCEISHIPRQVVYSPYCVYWRLNGIYFLTNAVYHDSAGVWIIDAVEEAGTEGLPGPGLAVTPNPFARRTAIVYSLPKPDDLRLEIYSVVGSRVATLTRGTQTAGLHRVTWPGTDDRGQLLPAGTYFIRLTTRAGTRAQKTVLRR
jgi:hypothetical protein